MPSFEDSSIHKDTVTTTLLSAVGKSLGFFVPFFIAAWFGTSARTDAFFFTYGVALFVSGMFGKVFEMVVVPYIVGFKFEGREIGNFVGVILVRSTLYLAGILWFLGVLFIPVSRILTRFPPETMQTLFFLAVQILPMIFLSVWTDTLNGVLNAHRSFFVSALSPLFRSSVVILVSLSLHRSLGIHALVWGYVLGEVARFTFSFLIYRRDVGKIIFGWSMPSGVRTFLRASAFQIAGLIFLSLITLVDQSFTTWLGPGALSTYAYAEKLRNIPFLLFSSGIGTVMLAHWSKRWGGGGEEGEKLTWGPLVKTLRTVAIGVAVVCAGMLILGPLIVKMAYGWGDKISDRELGIIAQIFSFLILGVPFQMLSMLSIRLLIILQEGAFFMKAAFLTLLLDAFLDFVLMRWMGLRGIAFSTSLAEGFLALLLCVWVKKTIMKKAAQA